MGEIDFKVLDVKAQPYAAAPTLAFRMRIEEPSGAVIHSISLHCQIRIEPQRRRYSRDEEERSAGIVRRDARNGATRSSRFCGRTSIRWCAVSRAAYRESICRCRAPTTSKSPPPSIFIRWATATFPLLFLFSGTVFAKWPTGLSVSQLAWHKDATYRMPVRVWRELMDLYFPNGGWLRLHRETLDELLKFKARYALATWDQVIEVLLRAAGEGGMNFEHARKIADAVLYEGYILYPYRASSRKNQLRWQFGVLAPRAWSEAGGCEAWWRQTECLVECGDAARVVGKVRFLQVAARTIEIAERAGGISLGAVGGDRWTTVHGLGGRHRARGRFRLRRCDADASLAAADLVVPFDFPRSVEIEETARSRR